MWRGYGPVVERHEMVEVPEKRYSPPSPLKSRGLATSLHPLAPFTVQVTGTRFPSCDALLLPQKGPTPSVCSRKAHVLQARRTRQDVPTEFLMQHGSRLERALRRLCRCSIEAKLFQQGQHIVVGAEPDDLAIPDLHDLAEPQFEQAPHRWKSFQGQVEWTDGGPPTRKLKNDLILCGKRGSAT